MRVGCGEKRKKKKEKEKKEKKEEEKKEKKEKKEEEKRAMVRFSTGSSSRDDGQSPSKRLRSFFSSDDETSHTQIADERSSFGPSHLKHSASSSAANIANTPSSMHSSSSLFSCSGPVFLDLDILDCNICMEVLSAPIFQVILKRKNRKRKNRKSSV
jgi:hypothetical protein